MVQANLAGGVNVGVGGGLANVGVRANLGYPLSIGATASIGLGGGGAIGPGGGGQAPSFQNQPVVNQGQVLFTLSIRGPQAPYPTQQTYTFPISPASIQRVYPSYANVYDVPGPAQLNGVFRVVDTYGMGAISYIIEGTTGWQLHGTDGSQLTGMDSISALFQMLNKYAALNAQQMANGDSKLYLLELSDYWYGEFWQVVPVGPQMLRQRSNRPLLFEYSLRLVGVRDLTQPQYDPNASSDQIQQDFHQAAASYLQTAATQTKQTIANYNPILGPLAGSP